MSRPLDEQVVVITGASTGIGRLTAHKFADRGATVVLAARSEGDLSQVAKQIEQHGGKAYVAVVDVANWQQIKDLAQSTAVRFGRIDTWVNNAAIAEYATVDQMSIEEIERIIQVTLMGQIYGMKAVLPIMKVQKGGTIINVGSIASERAIPLQAAYSAAKHGVRGFTEALRLELQHAKTNINVTLIMPGSINTPFFVHARSKLGVKPKPLPPVYEPALVADAILHAAVHPQRDIYVGTASKMLSLMQRFNPAFLDWLLMRNAFAFKGQMTRQHDEGRDNLFEPLDGTGTIRGEFGSSVMPDPYTRQLELHPNRKRALAAALIGGLLVLFRRRPTIFNL